MLLAYCIFSSRKTTFCTEVTFDGPIQFLFEGFFHCYTSSSSFADLTVTYNDADLYFCFGQSPMLSLISILHQHSAHILQFNLKICIFFLLSFKHSSCTYILLRDGTKTMIIESLIRGGGPGAGGGP